MQERNRIQSPRPEWRQRRPSAAPVQIEPNLLPGARGAVRDGHSEQMRAGSQGRDRHRDEQVRRPACGEAVCRYCLHLAEDFITRAVHNPRRRGHGHELGLRALSETVFKNS